jgi:ACS family glucarate transporter-like MFS transporter
MASNITFFISFTWLLPYLVSQWGPGAEIYAPIPLVLGMFAQWSSGWLMTVIYKRGYPVYSRKIPAIAGFIIAVAGLLAITMITQLSPLLFVLLFSVAVFGVEMTIPPSWSLCMDIGGNKSGTVSATMNMVGNIGSAFSAIIFPFFVAQVTIPFLADSAGNANSFFVLAAAINLLAVFAWMGINPARKLLKISARQAKIRLIVFLIFIFLVAAGALIYKLLMDKL